jgi:F0F1-type ATP synthase assembly protein I
MSESGPGIGYLVLFTEIGFTLLVTTLLGVFVGYSLDERLGTLPILAMTGFFVGAGTGAYGIYRLVSRFLATMD